MYENVESIYKNRIRRRKRAAGIVLTVTGLILALLFLLWESRQQRPDHSGIPDAVSSRTVNGECYLDVVANADKIEDEEEFARMVVQMYRDNSFHSMRLSTDLEGYPSRLEIKVYLHREDVNVVEPVFEILYELAEETDEKYKLYVDGKEIPCYY